MQVDDCPFQAFIEENKSAVLERREIDLQDTSFFDCFFGSSPIGLNQCFVNWRLLYKQEVFNWEPYGRNQACSYRVKWVSPVTNVIFVNKFWHFPSTRSLTRAKSKKISIQLSFMAAKCSIETQMEPGKPVVFDKNGFENQDTWKLKDLLTFFLCNDSVARSSIDKIIWLHSLPATSKGLWIKTLMKDLKAVTMETLFSETRYFNTDSFLLYIWTIVGIPTEVANLETFEFQRFLSV